MGRRLVRHLDTDLLDRMEAGWTPKSRSASPTPKCKPRLGNSYRGAKRNAVLRGEIKGVWKGVDALDRPFMVKPPLLKYEPRDGINFNAGAILVDIRERKQPKDYPYSSKRQSRRYTPAGAR